MIVNSRDYYRLIDSVTWFYLEADKPPCARTTLRKHYLTPFKSLTKNLRKVIKLMPTKKNASKKQFVFKGYVNISISEKHDTELKKYLADKERVYLDFAQCLQDGYAIKNHFDAENANHRCSITGFESTGDNFGYVIGGFAGDWYTALAVVLYKHFYVSNEAWTEFVTDTKNNYG